MFRKQYALFHGSISYAGWFCIFFCSLAPLIISAAELTDSERAAMTNASQGAVVPLKELWSQQKSLSNLLAAIKPLKSPQFLLSDKPEYFYTGNGISLDEAVKPGAVRLYVYHVPEPGKGPKVISAVIENTGTRTLKLHFLSRAFPKPSTDYHLVGKMGLVDYFNSKPSTDTLRIPPHGRMVIDPEMDATTVKTDQLVHGFYEFEISQPARIVVFQRNPEDDSLKVSDSLPKLPRILPGFTSDGAGRGLFLTNNFSVANDRHTMLDTTNGAVRLILADGKKDKSMLGTDSITGDTNRDHGNYGAMYHVKLRWKSSDGRGLALLMCRTLEGGKWCQTYAAAMRTDKGTWPAGTVAIPTGRVDFGENGEMVVIQKYPAKRKGAVNTIEFDYSPPGAACLPTPMILVPY